MTAKSVEYEKLMARTIAYAKGYDAVADEVKRKHDIKKEEKKIREKKEKEQVEYEEFIKNTEIY